MLSSFRVWKIAPALACALLPHLADADEPPQPTRVARLIRDLGAPRQIDRVRAADELADLGEATREQLELAAHSDDPEVRLRAEELLGQLQTERLWRSSRVAYQSRQGSVSAILAAIGQQTGNRLLAGNQYGALNDVKIDVDFRDAPFWDALDEICRQSGNHVRPHYDTRRPGLVVTTGGPGSFPVAHAGPVRAQITSARRVFIEELDYEHMKSDLKHTFQINVQMMWEDRFRLVAYRSEPVLDLARTDRGTEISATQQVGTGWNVPNPGTRQLSMNLRLQPPSPEARQLDALTLRWGVIAVGEMATLDVEPLEPEVVHRQDDLELELVGIEKRNGDRFDVTVLVVRDLVVPKPQEVLFHECRIELFDEAGTSMKCEGQSGSLVAQGARLKATFRAESSGAEPSRLSLSYPKIRSQRDLAIEFRDVPLPVARPE